MAKRAGAPSLNFKFKKPEWQIRRRPQILGGDFERNLQERR